MVARILAVLSFLQAVLIFAPPLAWPLWKLHYAALESCLLGAVFAILALLLAKQEWVRWLARLGLLAAVSPAISAIPLFLQAKAAFSPLDWLTGGTAPAIVVQHDVALGPSVTADLWPGAGEGARPAVIVVHGGSWRSGDKGEVPHVSAALAAAGYTVLDLRYRLTGEAPFPAAIEDVRCALATIAAEPDRFHVNPKRIALLGRSAGGEIVLDAAYADSSIGSSCGGAPAPVRAVVSLYGVTDVAWAHDNPYVPDVVDGVAATELYLGGTPTTAPERYRAATPQTWLRSGLPPTLLIHGNWESCVRPENSTRLADALHGVGATVELAILPLAEHGFDVRPGGFGEQLSRSLILDFLARTLAE